MTIFGIADSVISQGFAPSVFNYSKYGITRNKGFFHDGIDVAGPVGTPVPVPEDCTDVWQQEEPNGYGHFVIAFTKSGHTIIFGHLSKFGTRGACGKGTIIGYRGSSGNSTGPHTHVTVYPPNRDTGNGVRGAIDPAGYYSAVQSGQGDDDVYAGGTAKQWFNKANRLNEWSIAGIFWRYIGKEPTQTQYGFWKAQEPETLVKTLLESPERKDKISQLYQKYVGRPADENDLRIRHDQAITDIESDLEDSAAHKKYLASLTK